ncbi:four helix bundle protein [Crocinitomix sp.]|nr:four helix bundle protein [Crocinitomix sp.]
MHNFRQLKIWQASMELAKEILNCTEEFSQERKYGLTSQINRSAISIPSNIAEGSARNSDKDFARFLSIALGSAFE